MKQTTLDIYITEICNLNCEYCYVDLKKIEKNWIKTDSFMQRINLLEYNTIKFYWWEPLIKSKEIIEIIEAVHKKNSDIHFSVITNGLLLSDDKLLFFKKHDVTIAISIHMPVINKLLSIKMLELFIKYRDIITFNLLFREFNEALTTKIFLLLANSWFVNFSLSPVSNDAWSSIDALKKELDIITDFIVAHDSININELDWRELKNLNSNGFCTKEQVDLIWNKKICTRFDKVEFLANENNIDLIDNLFNSTNWCSTCNVRWFCVCNKWWYLDNFWDSTNFDVKKVQLFHNINELFINFYKKLAWIRKKSNFLTSGIEEIRFNLTEQCNLRCEYCYLDFKNNKLDTSIWKNIIDFFLEQDWESKILSFLGGEPLLEFALLEELVMYALEKWNSLWKRLSFKIATNWLLFTDQIVSFLLKNNFEIHLSFNWTKAIQDITRDNSYDRVISKIELLHNVSYPDHLVTILVVLFPDRCNLIKDNLLWIVSILRFSKIYLEMYIWKKYLWTKQDYIFLEQELSELYALRNLNSKIEIMNFTQKVESKFLDISTSWQVSDNSLSFFNKEKIDFSSKKYLDILCLKIKNSYVK